MARMRKWRENEEMERERKWQENEKMERRREMERGRENGERMRKWRENKEMVVWFHHRQIIQGNVSQLYFRLNNVCLQDRRLSSSAGEITNSF